MRSCTLMRDRQTCVGCGKKSPETETNYTLISAQFGWRLTRYKDDAGNLIVEWRCPTCWREYKRAKAPSIPDVQATRPSQPPHRASQPPPPSTAPGRSPLTRPPTPMDSFRPSRAGLPGDSKPMRPLPPPAPLPPRRPAPSAAPGAPPPLPTSRRPGPTSR
jgi:hypothetical protein